MTHLNGDFLVVKDHPRIIFRGKLDTLESELILCQLTDKGLEAPVGEILELARRIIRCEVLDEPLQWDRICGLTEEEQRKRSHFPQDYYGQPHFMPSAALREITGKTAIPEFQRWLEKMGFVENGRLTKKAGDGSSLLF